MSYEEIIVEELKKKDADRNQMESLHKKLTTDVENVKIRIDQLNGAIIALQELNKKLQTIKAEEIVEKEKLKNSKKKDKLKVINMPTLESAQAEIGEEKPQKKKISKVSKLLGREDIKK